MKLLAWLEAALARLLRRLLGLLSPALASDLGGALAAALGPLLPVSRVADTNLRAALPELDAPARRRVVYAAWAQLGRTAAELPHLGTLPQATASGPGWELVGDEVLATLRAQGGPAIFFSGHLGNWEILPRAARVSGLPIASFYRAAQNQRVDALMRDLRAQSEGASPLLFAKGGAGARQALAHLRAGGRLAMLVDQKLNDGIPSSLFGMPAMTAQAAASFALHFRCPLIPVVVRRLGPARLRICIEPPLTLPATGARAADTALLTQHINDVLERWIRAEPGAWLWMHRRWRADVINAKIAASQRNKYNDSI